MENRSVGAGAPVFVRSYAPSASGWLGAASPRSSNVSMAMYGLVSAFQLRYGFRRRYRLMTTLASLSSPGATSARTIRMSFLPASAPESASLSPTVGNAHVNRFGPLETVQS